MLMPVNVIFYEPILYLLCLWASSVLQEMAAFRGLQSYEVIHICDLLMIPLKGRSHQVYNNAGSRALAALLA
jgi:hypothetical protein